MKKKYLIIAGIVILAAAALAGSYFLSRPPAAEDVLRGFETALTADGRFEFSCMLETDGEQREYFWFTGERSGEARHLKGRVLGSPLELYYAEGAVYRYDEADGAWRKYDVSELAEAAAIYAELEPAGTFAHEDIIEMEYAGKSDVGNKLLHSFRMIPRPAGWVARFFTDVRYTVYASRSGRIEGAALAAVMNSDADTVLAAMLLFYPEQGIDIVPPQI